MYTEIKDLLGEYGLTFQELVQYHQFLSWNDSWMAFLVGPCFPTGSRMRYGPG
uniref:Uncharacterized protein n=1 Tax=Arundo donax TaxID=35708 RepID=A0A0A9A0N9_ARUDO